MASKMVNIAHSHNALASKHNDKLQINSPFHSASSESVLVWTCVERVAMVRGEKRPTMSGATENANHHTFSSSFFILFDESDSCLFRKQIHFTWNFLASLVGNLDANQIDWFALTTYDGFLCERQNYRCIMDAIIHSVFEFDHWTQWVMVLLYSPLLHSQNNLKRKKALIFFLDQCQRFEIYFHIALSMEFYLVIFIKI